MLCEKSSEKEEKNMYLNPASEVDAKHKRKYPDYVYNLQKARFQKAL
jgi:hypothetical protein